MAKRKKQKLSVKTDRPADDQGGNTLTWQFFLHPLVDWQNWYDTEIEDDAQGKHDNVLETLEQQPFWKGLGFYEPLKGYSGLSEIKIKSKVQWRLLGYSGPTRHQFTIVIICSHKDDNYLPTDAKDTALDRMKDIQNGKVARLVARRPRK